MQGVALLFAPRVPVPTSAHRGRPSIQANVRCAQPVLPRRLTVVKAAKMTAKAAGMGWRVDLNRSLVTTATLAWMSMTTPETLMRRDHRWKEDCRNHPRGAQGRSEAASGEARRGETTILSVCTAYKGTVPLGHHLHAHPFSLSHRLLPLYRHPAWPWSSLESARTPRRMFAAKKRPAKRLASSLLASTSLILQPRMKCSRCGEEPLVVQYIRL